MLANNPLKRKYFLFPLVDFMRWDQAPHCRIVALDNLEYGRQVFSLVSCIFNSEEWNRVRFYLVYTSQSSVVHADILGR